MCRKLLLLIAVLKHHAHRVNVKKSIIRIGAVVHNISRTQIAARKIIVKTVMTCHSYTRFLTSVTPVKHIMTRTDSLVRSEMVHINISRMTAHCLGNRENIFPSGS